MTIFTRAALTVAAVVSTALLSLSFATPAPATADSIAQQDTRPNYHYTPAQNWMNDPNGLIYYGGRLSPLLPVQRDRKHAAGTHRWGHAVSTDLTHWKQLPIAIPSDSNEEVWSGSVVVRQQ